MPSSEWWRRGRPFSFNLQPLVGALLGVWWLGEPLTPFTVAGGALILVGLHLTVKAGRIG